MLIAITYSTELRGYRCLFCLRISECRRGGWIRVRGLAPRLSEAPALAHVRELTLVRVRGLAPRLSEALALARVRDLELVLTLASNQGSM